MIELQVTLQILGVIALIILIAVLGYVLYMLGKINQKLDSLLEIITYYEKGKAVVVDFMAGPGRTYLSAIQSVLSVVVPLLTNRRKSR